LLISLSFYFSRLSAFLTWQVLLNHFITTTKTKPALIGTAG
jgi:hypothetical protein